MNHAPDKMMGVLSFSVLCAFAIGVEASVAIILIHGYTGFPLWGKIVSIPLIALMAVGVLATLVFFIIELILFIWKDEK